MNLQHHMDEQQEKHERLMAGRDPDTPYEIKCTVCGETFYSGHPICSCPACLLRDLMCCTPADISPSQPIPAPQEPSDGSGGTKTPLEEIEALKAKLATLERESEAWRNEAIGWRRRNARMINEQDQ